MTSWPRRPGTPIENMIDPRHENCKTPEGSSSPERPTEASASANRGRAILTPRPPSDPPPPHKLRRMNSRPPQKPADKPIDFTSTKAEGSAVAEAQNAATHSDETLETFEPTGAGCLSCVYVDVGQDANPIAVTEDLRQMAAMIVIMVCESKEQAANVAFLMMADPTEGSLPEVDPRGGGEKGKAKGNKDKGQKGAKGKGAKSEEEKQAALEWATSRAEVQYVTETAENLVVAGRAGVVKKVKAVHLIACDDLKGAMLICDVELRVSICNQMSIRVAAWDTRFTNRGGGVIKQVQNNEAWQEVADVFLDKRVRIIAGEFYEVLKDVVILLRACKSVRVVATQLFREKKGTEKKGPDSNRGTDDPELMFSSSAALFLGPVNKGSVLPSVGNEMTYCTLSSVVERERTPREKYSIAAPKNIHDVRKWCFPEGKLACDDPPFDETAVWPVFHLCKQKEVLITVPETVKLFFLTEGNTGRRSNVSKKKRRDRHGRSGT